MNIVTWKKSPLVLALALLPLAACATDPMDLTDTNPAECGSAENLSTCLPAWSSFSVLAPEADTVTSSSTVEVTEKLERFDDNSGELLDLGDVTFVCTEETHNFADTPGDLLTGFGIDETKIWPGALIQGRSHRDGAGTVLELPIRERAPINVTLSFNSANNSLTVDSPDNSTVSTAVGTIIEQNALQGTPTANTISFSQETYSSEEQAALAFGVSGRYFGFEASASGSVTSSVSTNVVAAQFRQEMYVAGVTQPATPAQFFSDALTPERLAAYGGQIGADNPPLYVSRIGYGRMMVFSMSAKAEANEIQGALSAGYTNIGVAVKAELSAKQRSILSSAEIRISQIGGDQSSALAAISSGNLEDYFANGGTPLQTAAPLWFELKTLDGQTAYVSEAGTYTETSCVPKLPGTFEYSEEQALAVPFTSGTQRSTKQADVNGDGNMDLVFNERSSTPAMNRTHIALAVGDGTFMLQPAWDHPENPAEGWQNYEPLIAEIDGVPGDDIVWNILINGNNVLYPAASGGSGSYTASPRQERPAGGWQNYRSTVADLDGDGLDDLLWSNAGAPNSSSVLRTYHALARGDGGYYFAAAFQDRGSDWRGYDRPVVGQLNGLAGLDYAVNAVASNYNNSHFGWFTADSDSTGTWTNPSALVVVRDGWTPYLMRVGNVDGINGDDLIWVDPGSARTYVAPNNGSGGFPEPPQVYTGSFISDVEPFIGDFNNDGNSDVLYIRRTAEDNELLVGFGFGDATEVGLSFPAGTQRHPNTPAQGWDVFDEIFIGDVNGDTKDDIVWTNPSSDTRIYVALSK